MSEFQFSDKLAEYLKKVETETGRRIEFHFESNIGLSGMTAGFVPNPSVILILLKQGTDWGKPEHEHSIAHEATHGYLIYGLGYWRATPKRKPVRNEVDHLNLLFTMTDDIVVNTIIQKEGFPPYSPRYLGMLERETEFAHKGSDGVYNDFSYDPLFKQRFMVFRYILAWGFSNYCDLTPYARKTINRYLKWFKKSFVAQFIMADQIRQLILQNDVFTAHGHRKTIEAVARLWHLDDLIGLQST